MQEFKQMVKALHEAGLEAILDVVYNHTAEGNHLGPTLSFKGLDNRAYYLVHGQPLDRRHAQLGQLLDRHGMPKPGVGAAQLLGDPGVALRENPFTCTS